MPLGVSVPVVWVALEYVRAHFPTGFPFLQHVGLYQMIGFGWYFLGYTQHAFLPLIQIADLGGVYAVSFVVAAVNGTLAEWVLRSQRVRTWLRWNEPAIACNCLLRSTVAVGLLVAASVIYGFVKLDHPEFEPGPRVAAIQGSVPQFEKNEQGQSLGKTYGELHLEALKQHPDPGPDRVARDVFPRRLVRDRAGRQSPGRGTREGEQVRRGLRLREVGSTGAARAQRTTNGRTARRGSTTPR